jgi:hypothetical protein
VRAAEARGEAVHDEAQWLGAQSIELRSKDAAGLVVDGAACREEGRRGRFGDERDSALLCEGRSCRRLKSVVPSYDFRKFESASRSEYWVLGRTYLVCTRTP